MAEHLALGAAFILLSFIVRGFTGFGAALTAVPLLSLVMDFKAAVVIISLLSAVNGVILSFGVRDQCDRSELLPLIGGFLAGLCVGIAALLHYPSPVLKQAFGVFVALFALRLLLRSDEQAGKVWPRWLGWPAGLFAGLTGGAFGAPGPPVVIYLCRRLPGRHALRATTIIFFLATDSGRMVSYLGASMVTPAVLTAFLCFLPASLVGSWVGTHLHLKSGETLFRRCVAGLLIATGVLFAVGR